MIASTWALARHGREHGYAVPAVNVLDDISLRAVVAAAVQAADHDLLVAQIQETLVQQVAQVRTVVVQAVLDGP